MGRIVRPQNPAVGSRMNQQGAGDIFSDHSDSESGMEDDEEDGDRSDSESAMEDDDEDDDCSDSESAMKDGDEDESKVFRYLVRQAKNELKKDGIHEVSNELLQEKFRELLISFLHWKDRLYKNPIFKKVMTNVRELQDEQFDRQEAIEAAVHNRRFLLNRVVPDPADMDDSDDGEGEQDDSDDEKEVYTGDVGV